MIIIIKARQRQYKTTTATAIVAELTLNGGYSVSDIVANIHLFKPVNDINLAIKAAERFLRDKQPELARHCIHSSVVELETYHYLNNHSMRLYVRKMVEHEVRRKIIFIDEIDRVFSHLKWHDAEQQDTLIGLWQDEKLENYIIGTAHVGLSVNKMIRESQQIGILTESLIKGKSVDCTILNALNMEIFNKTLNQVPLVQRLFATREAVK